MSEPLLNCTALAKYLGRGLNYVTAMKRAGYAFKIPGRTTARHAMTWLAAHPDFQATEWLHPSLTKPERRRKVAAQ